MKADKHTRLNENLKKDIFVTYTDDKFTLIYVIDFRVKLLPVNSTNTFFNL